MCGLGLTSYAFGLGVYASGVRALGLVLRAEAGHYN